MHIITIEGSDLIDLKAELAGAQSVRIAVEDGGVKVSADRGLWTLPLGQEDQ